MSTRPVDFSVITKMPNLIVITSSYLGNDKLVHVFFDDKTKQKVHEKVMSVLLLNYKRVAVMPSFIMKRVNLNATACVQAVTVYRNVMAGVADELAYGMLLKSRSKMQGELEEGVETFIYTQAYELFKGFETSEVDLVQYFKKKMGDCQASFATPRMLQKSVGWIQRISENMAAFRKELTSMNQYTFLTLLPGGRTFLSKKGETPLQRLDFIENHPEEISAWVQNDPKVQACVHIALPFRCFRVPDWICLLPNLQTLNLSSAKSVQFPRNYNPEKLQRLYFMCASDIWLGEDFNPPLKEIDARNAKNILLGRSCSAPALQTLKVKNAKNLRFGVGFQLREGIKFGGVSFEDVQKIVSSESKEELKGL